MIGYDGSTEHGISGRFRFYPGDPVDGDSIRRAGARLRMGYLGVAGHLSCLAKRAGRFVRCGLGHVARQYRTHGVGILLAVMALSLPRLLRGVPR